VSSTASSSRLSPWGRLVALSAVLVLVPLGVLAALAVASTNQRDISYPVRGALDSVVLDLGDASVVIARGGRRAAVDVRRTERYAFGHAAETRRWVEAGTFHVRSRCPRTVLHSCSVRYRVVGPDNVPVDVRTTSGSVRLEGYRGSARVTTGSGTIAVGAFCGSFLQARSESGRIAAAADCALQQLSVRSTTGDVHVVVPPGRYRLDAETAAGKRTITGVTEAADVPFTLQALSSSGNVVVEGRS
jgi:hypothetical protein